MSVRSMFAALVGALAAAAVLVGVAPTAVAAPAGDSHTLNWSAQAQIPGTGGSSAAPALATCANELYMMWKGVGNDQRLFFNTMDEHGNWTNQVLLPFGGSSTEPSIACNDSGGVVAVWKGVGSDERIFYSISWDAGVDWSPQAVVDGTPTTDLTPTIAWLPYPGNPVYMAWKGAGSDSQVYDTTWNPSNGTPWSAAQPVPSACTQTAPRATYDLNHSGGFGVVWKGYGSDPRFWAQEQVLDGNNNVVWLAQPVVIVPDGGTSATPDLAIVGVGNTNDPLMVWKGVGSDQRIFSASGNDNCTDDVAQQNCWNPQQLVSVVGGTSDGPAIARFWLVPSDGSPSHYVEVLVWKGASGDQRLFYSIGAETT